MVTLEDQLAQHRATLNEYAKRMNTVLPHLGKTGFDVLWRARRLLDRVAVEHRATVSELRISGAYELGEARIAAAANTVEAFSVSAEGVLRDGPALLQHPWAGIENASLTQAEIDELLRVARVFAASLARFTDALGALEARIECRLSDTVRDIRQLCEGVDLLSSPATELGRSLVPRVQAGARTAELRAALSAIKQAQDAWTAIPGRWGSRQHLTPARVEAFDAAAIRGIKLLGANADRTSCAEFIRAAELARAQLAAASALCARVQAQLCTSVQLTARVAERILALVELSRDVTALSFELRRAELTDPSVAAKLPSLSETAGRLRAVRETLAAMFPPAMRPALAEVRQHVAALAASTRFLPMLFSKDYRAAVKAYRAATGKRVPRDTMQAELRQLLAYEDEARKFADGADVALVFGERASGIDSPFDDAAGALRWNERRCQLSRGLGDATPALANAAWVVSFARWREAASIVAQDTVGVQRHAGPHGCTRAVGARTGYAGPSVEGRADRGGSAAHRRHARAGASARGRIRGRRRGGIGRGDSPQTRPSS